MGHNKNRQKAQHFALIQGFPGSGKTKVISILVDLFMRSGKRVLLTAHTHSAVDNVMGMLVNQSNNITR